MGRPLNKKFFGDPADPETQFNVKYWDGTTSANGYIVKQLGARRFRCTDGTTIADCRLSETVTEAGEMTLPLTGIGSDNGDHVALKISGRTATIKVAGTEEKVAWTAANLSDTVAITRIAEAPKTKEAPKKPEVEKVTEAVKEKVQEKPKPKVEEPKKEYKPRAKKAPAKSSKATPAKKDS